MKQIVVVIKPDGGYEVETKGYAGAECERATREAEAALGKTTSSRRTAEYHAAQGVKVGR